MNLFFLIQSLQLLIFYMDDQEFVANLDCVLLCFLFYSIIKVSHFLYHFIVLLHLTSSLSLIISLLAPCAYVSIESIDCILSLSFELKAILLISSVKTLCLSLLNLCCIFNIDLYFFTNSCQRTHSVETTSTRWQYYIDTLKRKYRRIST